MDRLEAQGGGSAEESFDLRLALEKLPEQKRKLVVGVYGDGKTVARVAQETGTPLGTAKRHLRVSLAELKTHLVENSG
jgi:RNA polymerase sigma factor (sigma-70 family)